MGIKPIGLSFKNTPEDKKLHEWICMHSNISGFIKDILRVAMVENRENRTLPNNTKEESNLIDLEDF